MNAELYVARETARLKETACRKVNSGDLDIIPYTRKVDGVHHQHMEKIDGLIFQFTSFDTLKLILKNKALYLNRAMNMSDPIENQGYFANEAAGKEVNEILRRNVRIACFCKPYLEINDERIPAYAMSRMWDQYAYKTDKDGKNFRGCCIGFDRQKLERLLNAQYPRTCKIGDIIYDLALDPEYKISMGNLTIYTNEATDRIFRNKDGTYSTWDESKAEEFYLEGDLFGFQFHKSFDYRDENEIRFSIYDSSAEDTFLHGILPAIKVIILSQQISDKEALQVDFETGGNVYKMIYESPYVFGGNALNQRHSKGFCKLKKITTLESYTIKRILFSNLPMSPEQQAIMIKLHYHINRHNALLAKRKKNK